MPRDNKTPLIQKIAKQAYISFKGLKSSANGENYFVADKQSELISLVTAVRAADLKIAPRKTKASSGAAGPQNPPVTYMHICETDQFSMGVFLLKSGASIPLHDHPGMHGMLKVMYGKVRISCFDRLQRSPQAAQPGALRRSVLRSTAEYTEDSDPCVLSPDRDNLHQIDAVDGPTAFMDILAPPYDPDDGRDCHYYRLLTDAEEGEHTEQREQKEKEVWLMEISQPPEFWCGGEPYPGPEVSL